MKNIKIDLEEYVKLRLADKELFLRKEHTVYIVQKAQATLDRLEQEIRENYANIKDEYKY